MAERGAALAEVRVWRSCLIVLDIVMPVMDGRAFLRELWRMGDGAETPVVLVSAVGGPMLSDVGMRVDDVIRKPFSIDRLLDTVGHLAS